MFNRKICGGLASLALVASSLALPTAAAAQPAQTNAAPIIIVCTPIGGGLEACVIVRPIDK